MKYSFVLLVIASLSFYSNVVTGFYVRQLPVVAREVNTPNTFGNVRNLYRVERLRPGNNHYGRLAIINSPYQMAQSRSDEQFRTVIMTRAVNPHCAPGHKCTDYLDWWNGATENNQQILDNLTKIIESVHSMRPVEVVSAPSTTAVLPPAIESQMLTLDPHSPGIVKDEESEHEGHEESSEEESSDHEVDTHKPLEVPEEKPEPLVAHGPPSTDHHLPEHEHEDNVTTAKPATSAPVATPNGTLILPGSTKTDVHNEHPKREVEVSTTTVHPLNSTTHSPTTTTTTVKPLLTHVRHTGSSGKISSDSHDPVTQEERFDFQTVKDFFTGPKGETQPPPPPPTPAPEKAAVRQIEPGQRSERDIVTTTTTTTTTIRPVVHEDHHVPLKEVREDLPIIGLEKNNSSLDVQQPDLDLVNVILFVILPLNSSSELGEPNRTDHLPVPVSVGREVVLETPFRTTTTTPPSTTRSSGLVSSIVL